MSGSTPRKQPSATVAAVLSSPQADDAAAATSPRKALSGAAGNTVATTMAATTHDNNNSNNNHNSYADAQDENDVSSTTRTRHCDDMRAIAEVAAAHVRYAAATGTVTATTTSPPPQQQQQQQQQQHVRVASVSAFAPSAAATTATMRDAAALSSAVQQQHGVLTVDTTHTQKGGNDGSSRSSSGNVNNNNKQYSGGRSSSNSSSIGGGVADGNNNNNNSSCSNNSARARRSRRTPRRVGATPRTPLCAYVLHDARSLHGDGDGDNNNSNGVAYREGNKTRRTGDGAAGGADDVFAMMTTSGAAGAATMATEPLTATCDTYSSRSCSKNAAQQPQQQQQPRSMREDNGSVSSARATATTTAVSPSVISRSPTQTHATRTTPTTTAVASGAAMANACYAHVIAFVNPGSGNRGAAAFILRTLLHELGASRVLLLTKDVFSDTTRLRAMIRDKAVCYAAVTTAASSSSNGDGSAAAAAAAAVRRLPRRGTVFVAGGDGTVSFVMTQIDAVRQELEDAAAAAAAATHAAASNNNNNKSSGSASALHKDKVEHMSKFVYDSEEDDAHDAATLSLTGTATVSSLSSTRHVAAAAAAAATAAASSHVADNNGSRCGARNDVECSRRLFLMPAIAPLPLGTGNDFSNCVGLGSGFTRRWLRCGCADDDSSSAVADDDVVAEGDGAHAAPSLLGSLCCVGCGEEGSTCSTCCTSRSLFACDEQAALVRLLRTAIAAPCVPFDRWAVDLVPLRVAQEYVRQRSPRDGDKQDDNNKGNTISKDVEGDTASVRTLTDTAASVLVTTCSDATSPPPPHQQQQRRLALRRRKHTPSQVQQQQQQQQQRSRTRPQRDGDADVLMSTTNDNNNDNDGGRDGNNNSKAVDNSVTHDASVTVTSRRATVSPTTTTAAAAATRSTMYTRNDDDDGGKGSIANAVHDVDWRAIRNDHQCVTRAAMNYFSIGYDAYITCQFDDFRRRHPNVCASRLRNKAVYGLIGVRAARRCRPLRALVPMVCVPSPYPRLYRTTTSTAATAAATSPSRLRRGGDGRVQRPRLSSPSARHGRAAPRDMVALQLPSQSKVLLLTNIDCYASGNHPWQPQRGTAYYKPVDLVDDTLVRLHDPHTPSPRVAASEQRSDTQNNNNGNNVVNAPAAAVAAAVAAVPPPPPPPMTGVVLNDRKFELQAMGGVLHYAAMNVHASSAQRLAQTDEMFVFVLCTPADLHCPRTTVSRYTRQHLQPYASRLPRDARLRASLNVQIDGEAMPRIAEPTIVHVRPYTTHRVRVRCLNPAVVQLRDTYGSTHNGDAPL